MKNLVLPHSGVELEVPDNVSYTSVGRVDDINDFYIKFCQERDIAINEKKLPKRKKNFSFGGACLFPLETRQNGKLLRAHYFAVSDYSGKSEFLKSMGHEEGHFLLNIGRKDLIKNYISNAGIKPRGFWSMSEEVKCELFGISALVGIMGKVLRESFHYEASAERRVRRHLRKYSDILLI